jgi:hypothetical protein
MFRKLRIQYPGAIYHLMNRGDHAERIFLDDLDRSPAAKAERLIAEAARAEGLTDEQIRSWRKGHPAKVNLALKLRSETTVTIAWIANRLQMGTRAHLTHLLSRATKHAPAAAIQPTLGI